jgi:hypothetical protein
MWGPDAKGRGFATVRTGKRAVEHGAMYATEGEITHAVHRLPMLGEGLRESVERFGSAAASIELVRVVCA